MNVDQRQAAADAQPTDAHTYTESAAFYCSLRTFYEQIKCYDDHHHRAV